MRRAAIVSLTAFACLSGIPLAHGHPTTDFDACAKEVTVDVYPCADKAEAGPGARMMLKASLTPGHAKSRATLWGLRPHADAWAKFGSARIRLGGRVRYYWEPTETDVYNNTSWRFRYVLPGHGHSDTVKVRVRSSDF